MSSKYNRLLLSTCLPLIAVSIISITPAYAGFEWTPSDKKQSSVKAIANVVTKAAGTDLADDITWEEPKTFDVIEGFGNDMPLALALRQIVPAKYAFSFGDSVNLGARVSWKGGKPWNIVLGEALSPLNIEYSIIGNSLKLEAFNPYINSQSEEDNTSITPLMALEGKSVTKKNVTLSPLESKKKTQIHQRR